MRIRATLLIVAALAWLAGWGAATAHQMVVMHAACAEHGDLVELDASDGAPAPPEGPVWTARVPGEHDHGCSLIPLGPVRRGAAATGTDDRDRSTQEPAVPSSLEARGDDVLARAPKTSPPDWA